MTTSGTTNYTLNQDMIIKRALRIVGALPQGDVPTSAQYQESAQALNDIIKEWGADGMQLWKINQIPITMVSGQAAYTIGTGLTVNFPAPLKVLNLYKTVIATGADIPMVLITRDQYNYLSNKTELGDPNQYWYNPPGNMNTGQMIGTLTLFNTPNTFAVSTYTLKLTSLQALEDFNATTDLLDMPSFYGNALVWALADQLAYENPTPVSMQDRISKKAMYHKDIAKGFDVEEGSVWFQPDPFWIWEDYGHLRGS